MNYHISAQLHAHRGCYFSTLSARWQETANSTKPPPPTVDVGINLDPEAVAALPKNFGTNQHMYVSDETKERLRSLLWEFKAPVRHAVAYGSGVFSQGTRTSGKKPMIDLIFGVTYPQHWHSLNLHQHRGHYSFLGSLGSAVVSYTQDKFGAGMYFNPYVEINGTMVKYGVVSIDILCRDLADWNTLYLAGRLHKPVKILRNDPQVLLANHVNLLSAVRVALLLLPETFTEHALYTTIAGLSYMGDPRMSLPTENPHKVRNIVDNQLSNFRRLYTPLISQLPNVRFVKDGVSWNDRPTETMLLQDMDPVRRGNMVRRLPKSFREKLYFQYQRKFAVPQAEFRKMVGQSEDDERVSKKQGGEFEQRIAADLANIRQEVGTVIKKTVWWPSTVQSMKGLLSAGPVKSWKYMGEKMNKYKESKTSFGDASKR
ncbi:mitochondrial matrix Mmp37 [Sphaerosporella brunnea]|uniref:Phosphatidate cytidylyltransferase, mitochondrial n=1 Tax=Sphaerosporella brunnea TaxID=1250544 RepID=A0A5J5FB26_9PEZI|nr:mitochondrial matrix Mmp37 [Sphaerosporella brunnea]